MADEFQKCRKEGCDKQVKKPFWYCFPHNEERKQQKQAETRPQPVPVEYVNDGKTYLKYYESLSGTEMASVITEFGKKANVFATQTHVTLVNGQLVHSAYVFYRE